MTTRLKMQNKKSVKSGVTDLLNFFPYIYLLRSELRENYIFDFDQKIVKMSIQKKRRKSEVTHL